MLLSTHMECSGEQKNNVSSEKLQPEPCRLRHKKIFRKDNLMGTWQLTQRYKKTFCKKNTLWLIFSVHRCFCNADGYLKSTVHEYLRILIKDAENMKNEKQNTQRRTLDERMFRGRSYPVREVVHRTRTRAGHERVRWERSQRCCESSKAGAKVRTE